jgi:hypothetical protein
MVSAPSPSSNASPQSTASAVPPSVEPPALQLFPPGPYDIRGASTHYDFRLTLDEDCSPDALGGGVCIAPGSLRIFPKGSDVAVQDVSLESIAVVEDDRGQPLVNAARLYDWQGTLEIGDFDFDGHEDFAVQDSEQGPYGGPTFQVFLYRPASSRFERSDELSDLTRQTLGFFQVDARRKRITTFAKSGCCYHVTEQYAVRRGALVMVSRVTEDAMYDGPVHVTTEKLVAGKWLSTTRDLPRKP